MTLEELHNWHEASFVRYRSMAFGTASQRDLEERKRRQEGIKLHKIADFHQRAVWEIQLASNKGKNVNLTELRIWHWERVESHRKSQRRYEHKLEQGDPAVFYNERKVADHKRDADFHLKCVQALNEVLDTTVHQDLQKRKQAA